MEEGAGVRGGSCGRRPRRLLGLGCVVSWLLCGCQGDMPMNSRSVQGEVRPSPSGSCATTTPTT